MAKELFFTSDTHYLHEKIIGYCNRPFSCAEEMDEMLVKNWNDIVPATGAKVYHLGDVYMGKKNKDRVDGILSRLNGQKVLIYGNHDDVRDPLFKKHFKSAYSYRLLKEHGVFLSHLPVAITSIPKKAPLNVHGHTHDRGSPKGPYVSACVEMCDYKPVHLDELKNKCKGWSSVP